MEAEIRKSFWSYLDALSVASQDTSVSNTKSGKIKLYDFVNTAEQRHEFLELAHVTRFFFEHDSAKKNTDDSWQEAIHNYFCQSGIYRDIVNKNQFNVDSAYSNYRSSFTKKASTTLYLAPLDLVSIETAKTSLDFGSFKIRRFSSTEFSTLTRNYINTIFYNYSAFTKEQIDLLSKYWYIYTENSELNKEIGTFLLPGSAITTLIFTGKAERRFTEFPKSIESALRSLCLFDWSELESKSIKVGRWSSKKNWASLRLFQIPFVLEISGDLHSAPERKPDITNLTKQSFTDVDTDKEYEEPEHWSFIEHDKVDQFVSFVTEYNDILNRLKIREHNWDFLDLALGYFMKAFFIEPSLERMLWYICSFESLAGESGFGVTKRLSERLGKILNREIGFKDEDVQTRFNDIYSLRNSLVHGGKFKQQAMSTDLLDSYIMARHTILWFLHILDDTETAISNKKVQSNEVPGREEILSLLDLGRTSRRRMHSLLDNIPGKL
jgi:hypothetical protein